MCSSKSKPIAAHTSISDVINGRPVLEPAAGTGNNNNNNNRSQISLLERRKSLKKSSPTAAILNNNNHPYKPTKLLSSTTTTTTTTTTPPISPKLKSPRPPAIKRSGNNIIIDHHSPPNTSLNSSTGEKHIITTTTPPRCAPTSKTVKKSKQCGAANTLLINKDFATMPGLDISFLIAEAPGTIAAARREQVAIMQVQRKMKTAHYGRTYNNKSAAKYYLVPSSSSLPMPPEDSHHETTTTTSSNKRCSFITSNSDPIYIAYHDEEWGVPVHDDKMLFELLVLTAAQLGSNWTSVLKKRQDFREAFSGFDAEIVSAYSEKKITSIVADYGIELSQVRGAVDNANRILLIRKEFGTLDKYIWNFVNQKPMQTQYKSINKIPVKTSKSESMSKDLVRRGFRYVGATVMLSFMQAAGLTNDHLLDCPRHQHCSFIIT